MMRIPKNFSRIQRGAVLSEKTAYTQTMLSGGAALHCADYIHPAASLYHSGYNSAGYNSTVFCFAVRFAVPSKACAFGHRRLYPAWPCGITSLFRRNRASRPLYPILWVFAWLPVCRILLLLGQKVQIQRPTGSKRRIRILLSGCFALYCAGRSRTNDFRFFDGLLCTFSSTGYFENHFGGNSCTQIGKTSAASKQAMS